jgi:glycogen phosphorylase
MGNARPRKTTLGTDGEQFVCEVQIYLIDPDPKAVRVKLYAEGVNDGAPVRQEMTLVRQLAGPARYYVYGARVTAARPATDYEARVIPFYSGVGVPLEAARIPWQQ